MRDLVSASRGYKGILFDSNQVLPWLLTEELKTFGWMAPHWCSQLRASLLHFCILRRIFGFRLLGCFLPRLGECRGLQIRNQRSEDPQIGWHQCVARTVMMRSIASFVQSRALRRAAVG